jgi:hypothetical protein
MVAFGDGTLSGCTVSGKTLTSVWNVSLGESGSLIVSRAAYPFGYLPSSRKQALSFSPSLACAVEQTPLEGSKPSGIGRAFVRAAPHPLVKGACLILVGTSSGFVTAWELTDTRQVACCRCCVTLHTLTYRLYHMNTGGLTGSCSRRSMPSNAGRFAIVEGHTIVGVGTLQVRALDPSCPRLVCPRTVSLYGGC